jgi:uncharacterized protein
MRRPILNILAHVVVAIYMGLCVMVVALQRRFVYFPVRWAKPDLDMAEKLGLMPYCREDGEVIAWQTWEGDPERTVIIFHGNGGNALLRERLVGAVRNAALDPAPRILILEYPGYGARKGSPSERSLTEAALDLLDRTPGKVVLLGESLGTGIACKLAGMRPGKVRGVALVTPFNRLTSVARFHYPMFPFRLLFQQQYNSEKNLLPFPGPVSFLLAENDTVVPVKLGRRLYNAYRGKKHAWLIPGATHSDISERISPETWRNILEFAFTGEEKREFARLG